MAESDLLPAASNEECFVVSPIGSLGSDERRRADNVLNHVIRPAVEPLGVIARRADEIDAPGSITSQIIQRLLGAKAVVVDLTGRNPNVYYELAIRDSFKLPVVLIAEQGTALASDIVGQRTIFFDSTDLSSVAAAIPRITQALREAIDNPSAASPVQAAAQLGTLSAGDAEQRAVAELANEVARLRRDFDLFAGRGPSDILIEELELGVRTYNALKRAGVQTVGDLVSLSESDLAAIQNMRKESVDEIADLLGARGLALTGE
jgi:Bacterial RNA polymerase, alpha chain C terminal domain